MDTEISSYMFLGVGVAISVIGFFLKREGRKVEEMKRRIGELELQIVKNETRDHERWIQTEKLMEDRRDDVRKLYDLVQKTKR
jgi:uncharacterized membrane protein YgaE (UPF0421/DUF939 family)